MEAKENSGYVDERYLAKVAEVVMPLKKRTYTLMEAAPGKRLLDAGCGPGTDTLILGEIVGPTGSVVGVDYDPEMIALAQQKAEAAGVSGWVSHQTADGFALPFEDGSFDAVRCERVFQHVLDPQRMLSELIRVTRAGGTVVVADTDWSAINMDLPGLDPDLEWTIRRALPARLKNGAAGRQLYRLFKRAELLEVSIEVLAFPLTDWPVAQMIAMWDQFVPFVTSLGLLTREQIESFERAAEAADREGIFFSYGCMMIATGRKT